MLPFCLWWLVSWLVLWAQSTTKDYITAEHELHSISKLFISQVVIPQTCFFVVVVFFNPICIPWALSTGTCIRQGDLFHNAGLHRSQVLATANTGEIGRGFGKMQVNGPEGYKEARKKSLAVSIACMAIYWPTPGFNERTFKPCVLNRWDVCNGNIFHVNNLWLKPSSYSYITYVHQTVHASIALVTSTCTCDCMITLTI